jgi:hypothetical protein
VLGVCSGKVREHHRSSGKRWYLGSEVRLCRGGLES